jgi:hypothetical protein
LRVSVVPEPPKTLVMLALGNVVYEPGAVTLTVDTPIEAAAVAAVVGEPEKLTVGTAV